MAKKAAIIHTNLLGIIQSVEGGSVIGWKSKDLIGRPITVIVPERFQKEQTIDVVWNVLEGEASGTGLVQSTAVVTQEGKEIVATLAVVAFEHDPFAGRIATSITQGMGFRAKRRRL